MKRLAFTKQILGLSAFCILTATAQAGIPVWSFSPNGSSVVIVSATGSATVSYTVTNNSKKPHQLMLYKSPAGISQVGGPCVLAAKSTINPTPTCTLTLNIIGSALPSNNISGGPILCQTTSNGNPNPNQCYQPSSGDALVVTRTTMPSATTLNDDIGPSSTLALSVKDPSKPALTGNPRQITIKNTGTNTATGLRITYPTWPEGSIASSTCGDTLMAGATCAITITPGATPTSNCGIQGIAPTPGTIKVSAANVSTVLTSNVVILSYGCKYQHGFLYSVDDTVNNGVTGTCSTPPCTGSIGGKIITLMDQAPSLPNGIVWSSNGGPGHVDDTFFNPENTSYDLIPGIDEESAASSGSPTYTPDFTEFFSETYNNTNPFTNDSFSMCNGKSDGSCNTENILTFYNRLVTNNELAVDTPPKFTASNGPTSLDYYAAGKCSKYQIDSFGNTPCAAGTCYNNWYLPAICEMGPTPEYEEDICSAIAEQNMKDNLPHLLGESCSSDTPSPCLVGRYWSSTEESIGHNPSEPRPAGAWQQDFDEGSGYGTGLKADQHGVRCSRALTP